MIKVSEDIVVTTQGKWQSRRQAVEADNIYGAAAQTVAKQDYEGHYVGGQDIYLRPRPPDMQTTSHLRYVLKKHGKLELGFRFPDATARREQKLALPYPTGARPKISGRFEIWSRDPNEGLLKLLGDCLPVVLVETGVEAQWQLWQRMLCGRVFFKTVAEARSELLKRHDRVFAPIVMTATPLPPSRVPDVALRRLEPSTKEITVHVSKTE